MGRRWAWLLCSGAALAATLAPTAAGANVATPQMTRVASWAAMKPVTVWCENDSPTWAKMTSGVGHTHYAAGYALAGGDAIYLGPSVCDGLLNPNSRLFGRGLMALLHEATHARGWRDEALTECAARVLIYSALHNFYGVPFFSERMAHVMRYALGASFSAPPEYQGGCDRL